MPGRHSQECFNREDDALDEIDVLVKDACRSLNSFAECYPGQQAAEEIDGKTYVTAFTSKRALNMPEKISVKMTIMTAGVMMTRPAHDRTLVSIRELTPHHRPDETAMITKERPCCLPERRTDA